MLSFRGSSASTPCHQAEVPEELPYPVQEDQPYGGRTNILYMVSAAGK